MAWLALIATLCVLWSTAIMTWEIRQASRSGALVVIVVWVPLLVSAVLACATVWHLWALA